MLRYNSVKRIRAGDPTKYRHDQEKNTPFPLIMGFLIYTHTHKIGLIDKFHNAGVSVFSKRINQLSHELFNDVCAHFKKEDMVVPSGLHKSVFITKDVDNMNNSPPSSIAKGSFHGTTISLFQHPDSENRGEAMEPLTYLLERHHSIIFLITTLGCHPSPCLLRTSRFLLQPYLCHRGVMKKNLWSKSKSKSKVKITLLFLSEIKLYVQAHLIDNMNNSVSFTGYSMCNASSKVCQQKTSISVGQPSQQPPACQTKVSW